MAAAWESAPLVEEGAAPPRAPAAPRPAAHSGPVVRALASGRQAVEQPAWAAAPVVDERAPAAAPAADAAPARPVSGTAAIPGEDGLPVPPVVPAPKPQASIPQNLAGALETAASILTSVVAQPVAQIRGVIAGLTDPEYGTQRGVQRAQQAAAETAQALTYQPRSDAGKRQLEAVGELGEAVDSIVPAMPMAQGLTLATNVPSAARAGGDAARAAAADAKQGLRAGLERMRAGEPQPAAPGTLASVGSSGTDMAAQRRARAESLPVPVRLTKGQAERTFDQQRFEKETAKDPDAGEPLRERIREQNDAIVQNFDNWVDQTGAEAPDRLTAGKRIVDPLARKAERAKKAIDDAYVDAREAGELDDAVPTGSLVRYLEDHRPEAINAPVLASVEAKLIQLGGATRDAEGKLVAADLPLNDLEEIRKMVGRLSDSTPTNGHFGGQVKRVIDAATDGFGGDLYRKARSMRAEYGREFEQQGAISKLLATKPGSTDRSVAFERVFEHSVQRGSVDDLSALKTSLLSAGDEGKQAWRELQGQTVAHLRDQALANITTNEAGARVVSPAKLDKAIAELDRDGKLELILGKRGAEQIRDLNDIAKDVYTAPPGAVNTSGTASVLLTALDTLGTFTASGLPVPAFTAMRALRDKVKRRRIDQQVREALGPADKPTPRQVDPAARPFEVEAEASAKPGGDSSPAPATPRDPRLDEIDRLREGASPETLKVLDDRAKAVEREVRAGQAKAARAAEAEQLEATAGKTTDPELRAALIERASKLRAEKIPAGEATELPVPTGRAPDLPKLPVGRAKEIDPAEAPTEPPAAVPTGQARELNADEAEALMPTPREAELARLRESATDPQVRKDLEQQITAERKRVADEQRADEYLRLAQDASDPALRADLEAKAQKLGAPRQIPAGEAVEIDEAQWRAAHRFGMLDAHRAKALAQALETDEAAARAAVLQHQRSPRAFDREIERINEQGAQRESQSESPPGGSRGLQPAQEGGEGSGRAGAADRGQGGQVRQGAPEATAEAEGQARQVAAQFDRATEPVGNPITDALSARLRRDYAGARAEYDRLPETNGGVVLNTDLARELSPDYRADRTKSADVHEPSSAFIKRVYADKLAGATPEGKERVVMFSAGGTGAGKTTGMQAMGESLGRPEIVFDTNMNTLESATQKIDQALLAGRDVRILYTYTDPVSAFRRAVERAVRMESARGSGRTVPIAEHVKTHVGASKVMRELAERYRDDLRVELFAVDNSRGPGEQRPASLADLPLVAENGLREELTHALEQAHRAGSVSDAVRAGFLATSARLRDEGVGRGVLPAGERSPVEARGRDQGRQHQGQRPRLILAKPARNEPAELPAPSGPTGSQTSVITERGLRVPVRYRLIDAGALITSHTDDLRPDSRFPQELQPRDRSRTSSEAQISGIENDLKPELLADSQKASDGAPIIGPDGLVESGNARTIALRRAYRGGKADGYRDWLADNAERFGFKADQVRGLHEPVLVRERTTDVDRADFARQANESPVSTMSEAEQAKADAVRLPDLEGLVTGDDGAISTSRSVDFVRDFMRTVASPAERNALMTADGRLSQRGLQRIRNAVFAKAYGDSDIVAMLTESTDANVKNILAGLLRAAPDVARVRDLSEAGARAHVDFVPDLIEAVRRFSALREAGQTVAQGLGQGSLIGGEASERVAALMRQLEADSRAPRRVAEAIQRMANEVDAAGDPRQTNMFSNVEDD